MLTFGNVSFLTKVDTSDLGLHTLMVSAVIVGDSSKEHLCNVYGHMRSVDYGASLTQRISVVNASIVPVTFS